MIQLSRDDGVVRVSADAYCLTWAADRPFVALADAAGHPLAELFTLSSVHSTLGQDDTTWIGVWQADSAGEKITLTLDAASSIWDAKRYTFECFPDRWRYSITVQGRGALTDAHYFGGYYSGYLRWGSGFFRSGQHFLEGFNPEPNSAEVTGFAAAGCSTIDLMGVPLPGRADWFFTPPPFCYALRGPGGWLGIGVEAPPGENRFTAYHYHGSAGAFHLTLAYEGHTPVEGTYTLPAIGFDLAPSPYEALACHRAALIRHRCAPSIPGGPQPTWWREPIFCGWGAQCYAASRDEGRAPDYARQDFYEDLLNTLAQRGVQPGTVVLDDKWQRTYGENRVDPDKWPDLAGFIQRQHEAGRRVLLWLKAWDPEGLPAEACVTNAAGMPVAADPTSPLYERLLRESVRLMLDDYGADGFKVDFTARIPSGPGLRRHGAAWGLELMKAYLGILHGEARQVKPDALIMTHTPHSYLADVVDMIRLNDINMGADVNRAMRHRAQVAALACPGAPIDTDNWPMPDLATWRAYVPLQPELGVPALYFATHIDSTGEALTEDDYRLIRETWAAYRLKLREQA